MRVLKIVVVLVLSALAATTASAANLTATVAKENKTIITLAGEVEAGDFQKLTHLIKASNAAGRIVSGLRLNSPGGSLLEAKNMAEGVRYAKITTVVLGKATCASACFLIFAAGAEKFANYTSFIGVHGASDPTGRQTTEAGAATVTMARIAKDFGVPPGIIGKMVVTPPEQMVWLTPDELRSMGTTLLGKPAQTAPEQAAKTPPNAPMQIAPNDLPDQVPPETKSNTANSWGDFIRSMVELSSRQNGGKPVFTRVCQPEIRVCITGIMARDKEGKDMLAKTTEDLDGRTLAREFCQFNSYGDVRTCTDWDTNRRHRDMKDIKGDWNLVSD